MRNSNTRLYGIWRGIKRRCLNPNYHHFKDYGGRGITICEEWQNYEPFAKWAIENGYSENLTIDRIDNDGNYEPLNCRWVDVYVQNNNTSRNHFIEYQGGLYTIAELADMAGIKQNTLLYRLKRGWDIEKAIKQPIERRNLHVR
jgi:Fic family protein